MPGNLAMLPTYHWMVYVTALGHPTLMWARLFTLITALIGLVIFGTCWGNYHRADAAIPTLLLATLPILQPFMAMVYTDVTALTFLLAAWGAQLSRRYALAAGLLGVACLLRQTNIIWGGFFAAWEALQIYSSEHNWRVVPRVIFPRIVWLCLLAMLFAGWILAAGSVLPAAIPENKPRFNIASIHFGALLWMVFMAPIWLGQIPLAVKWLRDNMRARPVMIVIVAVSVAFAVSAFALTYKNPHPWNRSLAYWEAFHLYYLRNWPLVAAESSPALRWVFGIMVVATLFSVSALIAAQRNWPDVLLGTIFGLILLSPHYLVDPRYFITPAVFLLFFIRWEERKGCILAGWWIFLCVCHAPFILAGRSIW
jgi:hypothetical protein